MDVTFQRTSRNHSDGERPTGWSVFDRQQVFIIGPSATCADQYCGDPVGKVDPSGHHASVLGWHVHYGNYYYAARARVVALRSTTGSTFTFVRVQITVYVGWPVILRWAQAGAASAAAYYLTGGAGSAAIGGIGQAAAFDLVYIGKRADRRYHEYKSFVARPEFKVHNNRLTDFYKLLSRMR